MNGLERRKINVGDKELEYYVAPRVRNLAHAHYVVNSKLFVMGFILIFIVATILTFFFNIKSNNVSIVTLILSIFWIVYFHRKKTVVAIDSNFDRYIGGKDKNLIKGVIAHEYGHRELFRWPPPITFIILLSILIISFTSMLIINYLSQFLISLSFALSLSLLLLLLLIIAAIIIWITMFYNQHFEEPGADKYALKLLRDKDLLIRLLQYSGRPYERSSKPPSIFSGIFFRIFFKIFPDSHPTVEDRIKMIEDLEIK